MFLQLPPPPPPAVLSADQVVEILADCEKGSRDCFPEDRVGVTGDTGTPVLLDLDLATSALATVFRPGA